MAFVHLHVHTEYSLLDGAARIRDIPKRVLELGQDAIAITDHGVMYGCIDFYKACKAAGVKPIIGCEVYVAPRSRFDKTHEFDSEARHLVLLCENWEGYQNLIHLVSIGYTEGFYIKPRVDLETLRQYSGGLIALSACIAGEIPRYLLQRNYEAARRYALELGEIFGPGNFFLELQDHGLPEQREVNAGLVRLSEETGIGLVATNDAHYLGREGAKAQDVLMCIQTNRTVNDPDRLKFETEEFYIKSEEEMRALFPANPQALENTVKIAGRCNVDFRFGEHHLPEFQYPEGKSGYEYFCELCLGGFARRYPDASDAYVQRLNFEMEMIRSMGFTDYFLIVGDFIDYARSRGIPVGPGRGSAAGSMVSYCLYITDVDPMKYNLLFERFLNPERVSMPDIDIDFCYMRRQEVIDYVIRKYGADHVAQIVTFGTMAARGAIRDVARALGRSYAEGDVAAKLVPFALHITLDEALKVSRQLQELYDNQPEMKEVIDTARSLEGLPRHASTHAAGVVVTKKPVYEYVPLAKNDEAIVTQYPMNTLEELGLLKMDFLGLRTLTVISDAEKSVQKHRPGFNIEKVPDDDKETFAMLAAGKTSGVFQMESAGMTGVCVGLRAKDIEDITAIIALYRPGPMDSIPRFIECKHNPEKVSYKHPALREILDVTYGCIVYQEQVIEIFRKLGGFSLGQADMIRRAMSKKKQAEILRERQAFISGDTERSICGAVSNGIDERTAGEIYDEILDFANYAFNKSHAVSYAIIAYRTAYLKCHYPREFMAALLTSVLDNTSRVTEYISECREQGIAVLPPDINESDDIFTVSGDSIRFGLVAVKSIGRNFIRSLIEERERGGPYRSLAEFCRRLAGTDINKRAIENLIKCGAMDSFGHNRAQLLKAYSGILDSVAESRRNNVEGQINLFGDGGGARGEQQPIDAMMPRVPDLSAAEKMAMERETTGMFLSGHPMDEYRDAVKKVRAERIGAILADFSGELPPEKYRDGQQLVIAGIITSVKTKTTKNNSMMAYVTIEDDAGSMEMLVFSRTLMESGNYIRENQAVYCGGKISLRDEKEPQLLCDYVRLLGDSDVPVPEGRSGAKSQKLYIKLPSEEAPVFRRVRLVLSMFPGNTPVVLYLEDTKRRLGGSCLMDEALLEELGELLGEENVVLK